MYEGQLGAEHGLAVKVIKAAHSTMAVVADSLQLGVKEADNLAFLKALDPNMPFAHAKAYGKGAAGWNGGDGRVIEAATADPAPLIWPSSALPVASSIERLSVSCPVTGVVPQQQGYEILIFSKLYTGSLEVLLTMPGYLTGLPLEVVHR